MKKILCLMLALFVFGCTQDDTTYEPEQMNAETLTPEQQRGEIGRPVAPWFTPPVLETLCTASMPLSWGSATYDLSDHKFTITVVVIDEDYCASVNAYPGIGFVFGSDAFSLVSNPITTTEGISTGQVVISWDFDSTCDEGTALFEDGNGNGNLSVPNVQVYVTYTRTEECCSNFIGAAWTNRSVTVVP